MSVSIRESERDVQLHSFTKTNSARATIGCVPRNPSLSPSELESARALARRIVDEAGSQTAAVAALGVSKAALSDFLNGGSVGMKLIAAIAHVAGRTIDEVLGHRPYSDAMSPRRPPAELASRPGYDDALAELVAANARAVRPFPVDVLAEAATVSFSTPPSRVTPELLRRVCEAIVQAREDASRDETAALQAEADASRR
jgi:transcriptional regulator with XRE-family HTH domain